ncbi:hypothetical protein QN277_022849 [Acacia crassicarpa]|uniref:Secreted protein n=1 Tax=Acacia crassicarpa TaxID=499986 RepID=A0AAE1JIS9_9FABA|nr:hypothetical protein QN277_022849 [Acacia crassicarpa]
MRGARFLFLGSSTLLCHLCFNLHPLSISLAVTQTALSSSHLPLRSSLSRGFSVKTKLLPPPNSRFFQVPSLHFPRFG